MSNAEGFVDLDPFIGMTMEQRENFDLPGQLQRARELLSDIEIEQEMLNKREQVICRIISDIEYRIVISKGKKK